MAVAAAGAILSPAAAAANVVVDGERAALGALVAAELAEQEGDARRALAEWQRLAVLVPDLPNLQENMMYQALAAGDYGAAERYAASLWQSGNYVIDARVVLITAAIKKQDWKSAERFTVEALDDPQKREWERMFAPILRGWMAVGRKDRAGVASAMPKDRQIVHPSMRAHEGLMLLVLGDKRGAAEVAAGLKPTDRISQLAAAQLVIELRAAHMVAEADSLRARVAILDPAAHDPSQMLPERRVKTAAAGVASWFAPMAASFSRVADMPSPFGETLARSALELAPDHIGARLTLAEDLRSLSRFQDALRVLSFKGPVPALVQLDRAETLLEMGQKDAALQAADLAIAGPHVGRDLLVRHTDFVRKLGDPAKSDEALTRLLDNLTKTGDEPQLEALILVALADLRLKNQPWDAVYPLMERAVALAPNDASVLNFAGYSAIERRKELNQSLKMIAKAAELEPTNSSIIDSLGWAYHLLGRHEEAVPLLEQAWRGQSGNAVIGEHLGDAYWIVGRRFEARNAWRAAGFLADADMTQRLDAKLRDGLTAQTAAP